MGSPLMLPGPLADLLNELGYIWPKSDELKLFDLGGSWLGVGGEMRSLQSEGEAPVATMQASNAGNDVDAFLAAFRDPERGSEVVRDGSQGSNVVGGGLFVAAGLVLMLKIVVIVQITILLAQIVAALAAAGPTFGASMAWIPVAKKLASIAINFALSKVITALMG